jgi:hypothetical protein
VNDCLLDLTGLSFPCACVNEGLVSVSSP